ncbi:hypothetical protein PILCRDRAFT_13514 [Piloderma croceum F 1598]|uniref:Uncharacterized protein n=1 Tax=Piloderma croceum (strain F 1598) TaxID=765440 RepID=A0A0C3F6R7_PILCF|nr:hypothetical protein PILCRDRAFT_13514 [Piloderma croceum F 1598]
MSTSPPVRNPDTQRSSEAMLFNTLRLVQEHLVCPQHPGKNQWCWVDRRTHDAEHIPLCFGDIQLWTKHLLLHGGDISCNLMPNTAHFEQLQKFRGPRTASLCRTPTEPVIGPSSVLVNSSAANSLARSNMPHCGLGRQYAMYFEYSDKSSGEECECSIKKILDVLHARYPAFDYPKYAVPLQRLGIHYLITASMFDVMFYITRVGMVVGAAHMFCAWVDMEMQQVKLGEREQGGAVHIDGNEDKESIDP